MLVLLDDARRGRTVPAPPPIHRVLGREPSVVVIGAYREGESRTLQRTELFGEAARLGWRMPLRGLSTLEVASFLTQIGGEEPSDEVVDRVRAVTGGNPFFLGEIVWS